MKEKIQKYKNLFLTDFIKEGCKPARNCGSNKKCITFSDEKRC